MLRVELEADRIKLEKQIEALKYVIRQDVVDKDRQIHQQALNDLEMAYNKAEMGCM